jgi:2-amino-4-hydroxy-6-hydroxymethyldihydropteridine diphosphokinase
VELLDTVVGLGSNLGDRRRTMSLAAHRLAALGPGIGVSALYESPPLGPPQPPYLNAAVRLQWPETPEALLERLLAIEATLGRTRRIRWGPRTLDLDLLWIAGVSIEQPGLRVPHPELTRRAFALVPLLDVAPEARHPVTGEPLARDLAPGARSSLVVVTPDKGLLDASWARW